MNQQSVLELEAVVQRDPFNAKAWYDLGVKQQENEREQKALQALAMAVDLDPNRLSSWLALAVSHTNDGDRTGTLAAVYEWAKRNPQYSDAVRDQLEKIPSEVNVWDEDLSRRLTECLMTMARIGSGQGIDPDVQIALAIIFNSNEVFDRSSCC